MIFLQLLILSLYRPPYLGGGLFGKLVFGWFFENKLGNGLPNDRNRWEKMQKDRKRYEKIWKGEPVALDKKAENPYFFHLIFFL